MRTKEAIISGHYVCTCDEIYKSRGLYDPVCTYHTEGGEIELIMDEFAKETAIDYAHWLLKRMYPYMCNGDVPNPEGEKLFDLYQQEKSSLK